MNASCPQCTGPVELTRETGSLMSSWLKEYYHCERCRITIQLEYQIIPDPPISAPQHKGYDDAGA